MDDEYDDEYGTKLRENSGKINRIDRYLAEFMRQQWDTNDKQQKQIDAILQRLDAVEGRLDNLKVPAISYQAQINDLTVRLDALEDHHKFYEQVQTVLKDRLDAQHLLDSLTSRVDALEQPSSPGMTTPVPTREEQLIEELHKLVRYKQDRYLANAIAPVITYLEEQQAKHA